jgi:hypothetical protein
MNVILIIAGRDCGHHETVAIWALPENRVMSYYNLLIFVLYCFH